MENNVKKFLDAVNNDEALQKKVTQTLQAYTGEKTDKAVWEAVLQPLAREAGCDIPFEAFQAYAEEKKGVQELSPDEFAQVAGGGHDNGGGIGITGCKVFGFGLGISAGSESGAGCLFIGLGWGRTSCITLGNSESVD